MATLGGVSALAGDKGTFTEKPTVQPTENKSLEQKALDAGKAAFHAGKSGVPALDPELSKLLTGLKVGEGLPILKAWAKGWHTENINAPVPPVNK